jgi:hypothetical protein
VVTRCGTKQHFALAGRPAWHHRLEDILAPATVRQSDEQLEAGDDVTVPWGDLSKGPQSICRPVVRGLGLKNATVFTDVMDTEKEGDCSSQYVDFNTDRRRNSL